MQFQKLKSLDSNILKEIIENSESIRDVLRKLDIHIAHKKCQDYVRNFTKEHNIKTNYTKHRRYTKDKIIEAVNKAICITDVLRNLGMSNIGNNRLTIKKYIEKFNIDISHFDSKLAMSTRGKRVCTEEEIFNVDSSVPRATLKRYITKHNLIKYSCRDCNLSDEWNNKPLVLQIEHINGINNDNRLENLCFLCPNCHSQTSTYAGKNA